jgi:hypothetical protein
MQRLARTLFAIVVAIALIFGAGPARAQELRELPGAGAGATGGSGPSAPKPDGPVLPSDMPVVLSTSQVSVPPVPAGFETRHLGWLELSYPRSAAERVAPILQDADAFRAELIETFGQTVLSHVEVRITQTVSDMARLAPASIPPPPYASGVAYSGLHLVLISMLVPQGAEAVDVAETFKHEMAHVALEDATGGQHVPVWFNEGLAIALSGELRMQRYQTLFTATVSGSLIPFADLDRSFPSRSHEVNIAYAESADFMGFLQQRTDRVRFAAMIGRVREGQAFDRAISEAYGSDLRKLEFQWRSSAEHRFSIIPVITGGGLIWVAVVFALGAAYVKRRRRAKAILARWEQEEAIEDALLARAAASDDAGLPASVIAAARPSTKIEHDGHWHTLH